MGANIVLAGVAGLLFGLDAVTYKKAVTPSNTTNATMVRIGSQAAVMFLVWLVATRAFKYKAAPTTKEQSAWAVGSGTLTALGVVLLGIALSSGSVTASIVVNQSSMLVATALGAAVLLKSKIQTRQYVAMGLAVSAIAATAM